MDSDSTVKRSWTWSIDAPVKSLHGPLEMFWRGLGYEVHWNGDALTGERTIDGQHRSFSSVIRQLTQGTIRLECVVRFTSPPQTRRENEIYEPERLADSLGEALARGFGPATASVG
jgi:hypothetical protein